MDQIQTGMAIYPIQTSTDSRAKLDRIEEVSCVCKAYPFPVLEQNQTDPLPCAWGLNLLLLHIKGLLVLLYQMKSDRLEEVKHPKTRTRTKHVINKTKRNEYE